jgi:hypothetical protein
MWIDTKEIPEQQIQSYIDEQRQLARNSGCEAMAEALQPILLKETAKVEDCKKEIVNLKRPVSRLKNRYENLPVKSCREDYPLKADWDAGYAKGLVDAWIDPAVTTPDDGQTVFFYDNSDEYHVGWYRAEYQDFDCDSYYVDLVYVLGWQPCVKPKGAPDATEID